MICNSAITIYHKRIDEETRLETWTRFNYKNAWAFVKKNASADNGYTESNNVEIRLPYSKNDNLDAINFSIGDIIVVGHITTDIETQEDLSNYDIYNINSISNNNFGISKHIHIGGI